MRASTTRNTHWSDFVEPSPTANPEGAKDGLLAYVKPDPSWVGEMTPMFPITSFVPTSECPHRGPIRRGSMFVCMCDKCRNSSGMDHMPALQRNPLTDPKLETKAPDAPLLPENPKDRDTSRKSEQWAPYAKKSTAA